MAAKNNTRLYLILGGVVITLALLAWLGRSQGWIGQPKGEKAYSALAGRVTIIEKVNASGKIYPVDEVKIAPEVSGEIRELHVREGDSVRMGDLLLRIRPELLMAARDRAEASLNSQKAILSQSNARLLAAEASLERVRFEYQRNKDLYAQKAISQQEFQASEAAFKVAESDYKAAQQAVESSRYTIRSGEATLKEASDNLRLTSVYAPMNGIITRLNVEKGERVVGSIQMTGTEMLRIANLNAMEVRVNVNENDIIRIELGDTAIVDVDAYSQRNEKFKGIVTSIANSANNTASSLASASAETVTEFEVRILLLAGTYKHLLKKGQASPFRPGMTASVDIITERKQNILSVPLSAVATRTKNEKKDFGKEKPAEEGSEGSTARSVDEDDIKEVVFVVENNKAKMVEVKTGISDFDFIEILSGIKEGQEVVKGPFLLVSKTLKEGDLLEVTKDGAKDDKKPKDKEKGKE